MDTNYWNLFWTTGLPEAWLMSRSGIGPARTRDRDDLFSEERQALSGPLASAQPRSDNSPGGPTKLY